MLKIYQLRKIQNTFEIAFKYKGVNVNVSFVDGNTYNDTPARCITRDTFKQRAIENSVMFKNKEIILERTVEEESDRVVKGIKKISRINRMKPIKTAEPQTSVVSINSQSDNPIVPETNPDALQPEEGSQEDNSQGMQEINFDNLAEAIVYVAQNWDVEVQTENEARKVLKEHGINPHIKR